MDWLKDFVKSLPLDAISEKVNALVQWWANLVENVPADSLPLYVYIGCSILALLLWVLVTRVIPKPLGGMSWVMLFALLMTPGASLDSSGAIAPASIGVVHSIMMKDFASALANLVPILFVIVVGFFLGFIWQVMVTNIRSERAEG